jgi:CTP:molybdopterin cytidylyltransferase MocA
MIPTNARTLPQLRIVVLAAGFSSRLGRDKPLVRVGGITLLARTLAVVTSLAARPPVVVVVAAATRRLGALHPRAAFVANPRRALGLSSSVRVALDRVRPSAGVLLLPVDLADLTRRDLVRLILRWRGARRSVAAHRVVEPSGRESAGTPLILPHWLYARSRELSGDRGLRDVVRRLPAGSVRLLRLRSADSDVDTPADLERARRRRRLA